MSAILESQAGDMVVCIEDFHASPDGSAFAWDTSRKFTIGERLIFTEARENPRFEGRPNAWLMVVEAADGQRYAASQSYFVTEDAWKRLERHFQEKLANCQV